MDRVLDALVEICDPLKHTPEVQKLNPGLYHDWAVLKAAQLALIRCSYLNPDHEPLVSK